MFVFFFLPGLALASWATRTPQIRDALNASIAQMGLVLFGLSIGSMVGILSAGRVVRSCGTRFTGVLGLWLVFGSLVTVALGVFIGHALVAGLGLFLFGLGMGMAEIGVNLDGSDVERLTGRPVLHLLHGCFSLGTLCGSVVGLMLVAAQVSVEAHLLSVACLTGFLIVRFRRDIPSGFGLGCDPGGSGARSAVWRDYRVIKIGLIAFAMALAEGAANDWLPILMVDEHGFSQASGSLTFVAFTAAMTLGRFSGGAFIDRFGTVAVMRGSALVGLSGIAYISFGSNAVISTVAVFLWGIGASLAFPLALSAAGHGGSGSAARVQAVAIVGYVAMLVGPPILGFVGESFGLRNALIVVLFLVALAALLAPAVRPRMQTLSK